mmetsp:Transcript_36490/g.67404  ORF Transcript_36490/g.67404 Transcript_36490/m.67404 type:complete len:171 (-) Transcript_36490:358-870(-)
MCKGVLAAKKGGVCARRLSESKDYKLSACAEERYPWLAGKSQKRANELYYGNKSSRTSKNTFSLRVVVPNKKIPRRKKTLQGRRPRLVRPRTGTILSCLQPARHLAWSCPSGCGTRYRMQDKFGIRRHLQYCALLRSHFELACRKSKIGRSRNEFGTPVSGMQSKNCAHF